MAYKKYIKRGEKIYGPYIYHSRRVGGKVVSEYHGQKKFKYKNFLFILLGVFLLIALIYIIGLSDKEFTTGQAVLDLDANYQEGEPLQGKIKLSLQEGELIPMTSKLVFENNDKRFEYNLNELISEDLNEGDFYIQGNSFSGKGEGYGIPGNREIFPTVYFTLSVLSEQKSSSINESNENQTETNDTQTNQTQESAPITGSVVSDIFSGLGITGKAVVEFENEIQGEVSSGDIFTYKLEEGQRVELKPRSVKTDSKQLADNEIELNVEDNNVIVTTNYSEIKEGFGEEYIGNNTKAMDIDLSELGLILEQGDLMVSLEDNGQKLVSLESVIGEGEISANKTISPTISDETTKTSESSTSSQTTTETTQTDNQSAQQETKTNVNITIPEIELTQQEKEILASEFGENFSVQVTEANLKRGFIVVRYEIGNYWIEHSYDSELSNETLQSFIEADKVKWLKDIAKSLSPESETEQEIELP